MTYILSKSTRKDKKYMLEADGKKIHFGSAKHRDYTAINNPSSKFYIKDKRERDKVRTSYRTRHRNDPYKIPLTPASLSWFILWGKPTFNESVKDYSRKIGVDIINKV
tara:strand:+ start:87 stop:410 length:324 start_codon:yes stop_codon:yes gene_type:complete